MNQMFNKIEASFRAAMKGEETVHNLIWWWGAVGYLVAYFIIDKIIKINHFKFIDVTISLLAVVYFSWHVYALKKCAPKKPKLSKEEKKRLSEEARKDMGKRFMRKLLLQESITKWDPIFITIVIDLFCIANFLGYVLR
jgi:predicted membrane protein